MVSIDKALWQIDGGVSEQLVVNHQPIALMADDENFDCDVKGFFVWHGMERKGILS